RFCRPNSARLEPRIAYHHPLLDARFGIDPTDDSVVWTDDQLQHLVDNFLSAAQTARDAGFRFVDVKACHGCLLHEFLGAHVRPGQYGGDFAGRTRLLCEIIERIRAELPDLIVVVRLSAFDTVPYERDETGTGRPTPFGHSLPYHYGF